MIVYITMILPQQGHLSFLVQYLFVFADMEEAPGVHTCYINSYNIQYKFETEHKRYWFC